MRLPVNRNSNQSKDRGRDRYALDHTAHFADHASKWPTCKEDQENECSLGYDQQWHTNHTYITGSHFLSSLLPPLIK